MNSSTKSICNFILLFLLGFLGMLICHVFVLFMLGYGDKTGIHLPFFALTYPIIYPLLAALWSLRHRDHGLANGIVICLAPFLYWISLLWSDGKLHLSGITFYDSTSMIVIMPVAIALSCLGTFVTVKLKNLIQFICKSLET